MLRIRGAKEISKLITLRHCPKFKVANQYYKKIRYYSQIHERIEENIKRMLERQGFECEKEKTLAERNIIGRIDLLCRRGNEYYIIDVKSYPIRKASLQDLYQVLTYSLEIINRVQGKINLVLIYREDEEKYLCVKITNIENLIKHFENICKSVHNINLEKFLIPGPWCRFCAIDECMYNSKNIAKSFGSEDSKDYSIDDPFESLVSIYQELVKFDWALMKGNFIPIDYILTENGYLFISPAYAFDQNVARGMDLSVIVFAILYALAEQWRQRGTGETIDEDAFEEYLKDKLAAMIDFLRRNIINQDSKFYTSSPCKDQELHELLLEFINALISGGLLHLALLNDLTTIRPIKFLDKRREVTISEIHEFLSLIAAYKMMNFTEKELKIDLPSIVSKILRKLRNKYDIDQVVFKTAHGELIRLVSRAGALPSRPANYETLLIPFVEEPIAHFVMRLEDLKDDLQQFIGDEFLTRILIEALREIGWEKLSYYQYNYLKDLLSSDKPKLALLVAPTGSGKTIIFTIYALAKLLRSIKKEKESEKHKSRVIIIYPRKSLARDQLETIIRLLYYLNAALRNSKREIVVAIRDGDSPTLKSLIEKGEKSIRDLRIKIGNEFLELRHNVDLSRGKQPKYTVSLINPKRKVSEEVNWIKDLKDPSELLTADIIITNINMFSKATLDTLVRARRSEWFEILSNVSTIIIDEAHTQLPYDQLAYAFHALARFFSLMVKKSNEEIIESITNCQSANRRKEEIDLCIVDKVGLLEEIRRRSLDIIISSATISNRQLLTKNTLTYHILGVRRIKIVKRRNLGHNIPEELKEFTYALLGRIFTIYNSNNVGKVIYRDYYLDSSDSQRWRLMLTVITFPTPDKRAATSLTESLLTVSHWLLGLRYRLKFFEKGSFITFVDDKQRIREILGYIWNRQIYDAKDHADRLFMTELFPKNKRGHLRKEALNELVAILENLAHNNKSLLDLVFHEVASWYNLLHFYISYDALASRTIPILREEREKMLRELLPYQIVDKILRDAEEILEHSDISQAITKLLEKGVTRDIPVLIADHHADLQREARSLRERALKEGLLLGVISTSTLELGIDIRGVSIVIQYGSRVSKESVHQRIGRAGRSPETFRTSLGIIILRNTGEDIALMNEQNAIDFTLSLTVPPIAKPIEDKNIFEQYALLLAYNFIKEDNDDVDQLEDILLKNMTLTLSEIDPLELSDIIEKTILSGRVSKENYDYLVRVILGGVPLSAALEENIRRMCSYISEIRRNKNNLNVKQVNDQRIKVVLHKLFSEINKLDYFINCGKIIREVSINPRNLDPIDIYLKNKELGYIDKELEEISGVVMGQFPELAPALRSILRNLSSIIGGLNLIYTLLMHTNLSGLLEKTLRKDDRTYLEQAIESLADKYTRTFSNPPIPHEAVLKSTDSYLLTLNNVELYDPGHHIFNLEILVRKSSEDAILKLGLPLKHKATRGKRRIMARW
ncbi:MAG: DEAD/DEAH box helicase [Candidatus Njordarchaeales archaeon]